MSTLPIFRYTCTCCGEIHEGAPSFSYNAPATFNEQPEAVQQAGHLSGDLCTYADEDGDHHFIRVCLEIPIIGFEESFTWGIWSSISETNYERYIDTYDNPDLEDCYFGWFSNYLPYYPSTFALKLDVRPRADGNRPIVIPEESDHPLSIDFHNSITFDRAREIAEHVLHQQE